MGRETTRFHQFEWSVTMNWLMNFDMMPTYFSYLGEEKLKIHEFKENKNK